MEQNNQTLNDDEFFEHYCISADIMFNNGENEVAFIKDKNFTFRYVSKAYKEGLKPNGTISQGLIQGIKGAADKLDAGLNQKIRTQDELSKSSLDVHYYIYIDIYNRIALIRKSPIINPSTGNFVGILGRVNSLQLPNILDVMYKINKVNKVDLDIADEEISGALKYELTQRQHLVLFFYVNKYSHTETASILTNLGHKISAGRVKDHLENLKYIFRVKTKEQLIEKAISLKYHLFIPRQLLQVGSFALDDAIFISELE